jgi:hypothetical protein
MKKLLFLTFVLMTVSVFAQTESRTVEVAGKATKKYAADFIWYSCTINEGDRCEIPVGKNYEKMIKNCAEESKKLFASRAAIYEGVVASFGSKIRKEAEQVSIRNGVPNAKNLYFSNYNDLLDFEKKLFEFKGAFSGYIISASYTGMNEQEYQKIQIESLQNTRKKAENLAQALGVQVDKVLNIYENAPGSTPPTLLNTTSGLPEYTPSPIDESGQVSYTAYTYVKFSIK